MLTMHLLIATMLPFVVSAAFDLDQLRWQNRVVLVFAPSTSDRSFVEQKRILEKDSCGVEERDIVTFLAAQGDGQEGTEGLRSRFNIPADQFQVLLIGKDGGVKLRRKKPLSAAELFATIDVMPMRRSEMRTRGSSCK